MTSKQAANRLLWNYKLAIPTLDNLDFIIAESGYDLIDYDPVTPTKAFEILAEELGLTPEILQQNAFTYNTGSTKLVFLKENLTLEEKRLALAHELGHIFFKHLQNPTKGSSVQDEYEANEFAHYLLHPSLAVRIHALLCRHAALAITAAIVIVALIVGGMMHQNQVEQTRYNGEYYATQSGKKYHKPSCSQVKNKTNLHRVTIEEIEGGKYEPCKICITD